MITRLVKLPKNLDFFLFGPRSTGKTTLLKEQFSKDFCYYIDLLDPEIEERFSEDIGSFGRFLDSLDSKINTIIIDEIQKIPKLLDVVQLKIHDKRFRFILTGSSARKLKRGKANLLGGRAALRSLWSFVHSELNPQDFNLDKVLHWGTLPQVFLSEEESEKKDILQAYVQVYLSEEVVAEQLVRNLTPFRKFIRLAGQMNGKVINASKIGRDVGTDHNTIRSYFEILEDTLIGFTLPAYSGSFRKRLRQHPKFYIFDTGVGRALSRHLDVIPKAGTSYYGELFEQYIITELFKLSSYFKPDWELSYLCTKDDAEIDVVIIRPESKPALIEIKSASKIDIVALKSTFDLMSSFGEADCYVFSNDPLNQLLEGINCLHWREGFAAIGLS